MGQTELGIRLRIDAAQGKAEVDDLSRALADLNRQMKEAVAAGDSKSAATLMQAIDHASSGRRTLMAQVNQEQAQQVSQNMKSAGVFDGQYGWLLQNAVTQITDSFIRIFQDAHQATLQRARGNYGEAAVLESKSRGELIGGGIATAVTAAAGVIFGKEVATILAPILNKIGVWLGGEDSRKKEEGLAWSSNYKSALPSIDALNQLYGGAINRQSADENNRQGLAMYGRAKDAADGTGLDTDDFIQAMRQMGNYGITSETQALNMTRQQALWSRFTGADLGTIQKVAGQAKRYAGEDNAVSVAYGGLRAQDMGVGQFTEFLNSLERIMADGISKGFVRSTEEIASNMAMLYRLSGGSPLWQGEQGAQRLSQMNSAVSNATNLETVEDVITYSVARDLLGRDNPETDVDERRANFLKYGGDNKLYSGDYTDEMTLLERGVSADMLKGQWAAVRRLEGDNNAAMIERFKTMYGLNYTGAKQVWAMSHNAWDSRTGDWKEGFNAEEYEKKIKEMQETSGYRSDSSILQDLLNTVKNDGIKIGKIEFNNTELPAIKDAAKEIRDYLLKKEAEDARRKAAENAPPVDVPSLAPPVPMANGGGPAGTLQMFQGGQRFTNYMMTGLTDFQMLYGDMVSYKDRERGTDYGEYIARRMNNALAGLDFDALNPTQDRVLGIGLENLVADFARYKGGGITEREYTDHFERQLQQLTSAIEAMKNAVERLEKDGIQVSGEIHGEIKDL